jgi:hypothetical protein
MEATATVKTASAHRYLGQFCKHFAHKLPVELDPGNATGLVTFGIGTCRLDATDHALTMRASAAPEQMAALQDVVARHLVRFAFREELALAWVEA